jgi:hypothetical protein
MARFVLVLWLSKNVATNIHGGVGCEYTCVVMSLMHNSCFFSREAFNIRHGIFTGVRRLIDVCGINKRLNTNTCEQLNASR